MGNTALGWTNLVPSSTMSATSSASGFAPANLQSDQCTPATGWQTAAGVKTPTLTATFAARSTVRVIDIVNTNLTTGATVTFNLYQSPSTLMATVSPGGPAAGYNQVVGLFSQDYSADYATVVISDTLNSDNHINIGGCYIGPLWIPTIGASWDTVIGRDDRVDVATSVGGQEWPLYRWQRRRAEFGLPAIVTSSELWTYLEELDRTARLGGNVLLIPDITSSTINRETIYGRLAATADISFPFKTTTRRAWRARITERL